MANITDHIVIIKNRKMISLIIGFQFIILSLKYGQFVSQFLNFFLYCEYAI